MSKEQQGGATNMKYKLTYVKTGSCYQYEIFTESGALLHKVLPFSSMQEAEMQAKIKIRMLGKL